MGQKQFRHQRKAPLTHLSWKLLFNLSFDTIVPRSANTFTTTLYAKSLKIWIFSLTIYQNFFERKNFKLEFLCNNKKVCKFCVDSKNRLAKSIWAKTHFLYVYTLTPTRLRRVGVSVISSQHLLYHLAVHVGHMCDNGWTSGICRVYSAACLSEESQNRLF